MPSIRKLHSSVGTSGVGPAVSTGQPDSAYWPGGSRSASSSGARRRRLKPRETNPFNDRSLRLSRRGWNHLGGRGYRAEVPEIGYAAAGTARTRLHHRGWTPRESGRPRSITARSHEGRRLKLKKVMLGAFATAIALLLVPAAASA